MKSKLFAVLFLALSNALILEVMGNLDTRDNSQFIYGKVTTIDNETYEGHIRWGTEEVFWFDFFNSEKPENDNLKWLSKDEVKNLNHKDHEQTAGLWKKWGNNWNYDSDHTHLFACQFGDIKSIEVKSRERVNLMLKNGEEIRLKGGSNDIGAKIQVSDNDLGVVKLDWNRVHMVEFMSAPSNAEFTFGEPLYGTVETDRGTFSGYLQWDHDERLSHDELNGKSEDGEMDIEFGNIRSIEKAFNASVVTLKSGRSFKLRGSNDVDNSNRGIIVNNPDWGRVDIPWDEFEKMTIEDNTSGRVLSYSDFRGEENIAGIVRTHDGDTFKGRIVFDLDETYKLEMLNGVIDDIEYFVPFSHVKSIQPKNREESMVELGNGKKLVLEDKVDVTEANDGVLVFDNNDDRTYIPWEEIDTITFE